MTDPKPRRWPKRLLKFFVWTTGTLAALWTVTFALATWELNRVVAELKKRGEPTTFVEAVARNVEKADYHNAVEHLLEALRDDARVGQPGRTLTNFPGYYDGLFRPEDHAAVKQLLSSADRIVSLLEEAVAMPPGPLTTALSADDLEKAIRFRECQDLRSFGWLLLGDVKFAAQTGDARHAVKRLKLSYQLSDLLAAEQFVVPQLIRAAMISVSNSALQQVMPTLGFTRDEFAELDGLLAHVERNLKFFPAMVNERAATATVLETPSAILDELRSNAIQRSRTTWTKQPWFVFAEARWTELIASPVGLPVRRRAAANVLEIPNEALKLVDTPPPWPAELQKTFDECDLRTNLDRLNLGHQGRGELFSSAVANLRTHRRLVLLRLALRLKRYHHRHGELPDRLEAVCDSSMPDLPTAWFEGKPFRYSKKSHSFRIDADASALDEPFAKLLAQDRERAIWGLLFEMSFTPPKKPKP